MKVPQSPTHATRNALSHVPTHHLSDIPHRQWDDAIRELPNNFRLSATVPRLPREMHFHMSQHITFSHIPHRQWDGVAKTTRKHSSTPRPPPKKTRTLRYAFGKK